MVSKTFVPVYLAAFVAANLLVKHCGAPGLLVSSFVLIPFDFVCRCIFHETWKGKRLVLNLLLLTAAAGLVTFLINKEAANIAAASFAGFAVAQLGAGLYYQANKKQNWFRKVNVSDAIGIVLDSIVFQLVAFATINPYITAGQVVVKLLGGLLWFFILFRIFKIQKHFYE